MVILIAVVGLAVVYLAMKSPDVNLTKEALPPNDNIPMLGAVGNPSPAMSNGTPVASQVFRTKMQVNAGLVGTAAGKFTALGNVRTFNATPGVFRPPTQTVAEMGKTLMTQAPAQLIMPQDSMLGLGGKRGMNPIKL
jgi:hypothetical protein